MRPAAYVLVVCFLGAGTLSATGQTTDWIVNEGNWGDDLSWNNGEPVAASYARITNGGTATITQAGERCSYLRVASADPGSSVHMTGGSLGHRLVFRARRRRRGHVRPVRRREHGLDRLLRSEHRR